MDKRNAVAVCLLWVIGTLLSVTAAAVIALLLSEDAHASQLTKSECYVMALDVYNIATWRDGGMPEYKAQRQVKEIYIPTIGQEGAYLRNAQDLDTLLELVHRIWLSAQPAQEIAIAAYQACVAYGFGNNYRRT